jgi:AcrR family transcriptional regulator
MLDEGSFRFGVRILSKAAIPCFEPRKTPIQARSTASVEAIMQATIQVLLKEGKSKLTTTRVAERAGVSVGTLYQYFPNKSSLLQALLKQHLDNVALAMETACEAADGTSLTRMAEAVIAAFVQAKFHNIDASVALYSVSDDLEGKRIARTMHTRAIKAMTGMLETAPGKPIAAPDSVAAILLSAMAGVSRAMLESGVTRTTMATMERELTIMVRAYLQASARNVAA